MSRTSACAGRPATTVKAAMSAARTTDLDFSPFIRYRLFVAKLLIPAAHLDIEAVRIHHVEARAAVGAFADLESPALQFSLEGGFDGLIGVPSRDAVGDVIDFWCSGWPVASDQGVVAELKLARHAII